MISNELKLAIDKIQTQGKMIFIVPATEEKIKEFEKNNSVIFLSKYNEYLF